MFTKHLAAVNCCSTPKKKAKRTMSSILKIYLVFCVLCGLVSGVTIEDIECDLYSCANVCFTNPHDGLVSLDVSFDCSDSDNVMIVPPSNSNNRTVYRLDISNICIKNLPRNLCDYQIVTISVTNSSLTAIPDLSCLSHLSELDLSYNHIRRLQDGIFKGLDKLQNIDLKYNAISSIGHNVFTEDLKQVIFVHLEGNDLRTVEAFWAFAIQHPYCIFNLSYNRITHFSNEAGWTLDPDQRYGPAWFDLTNNQFSVWVTDQLKAYGLSPLSELGLLLEWVFDFRYNPWTCDCHFYDFLKIADNFPAIRGKAFFDVHCNSPAQFKGVLLLKVPLDAFVCNISQKCPTACLCQFQPYRDIMYVDCRSCGLTELPQILPEGTVELLLSNNSIQTLDYRPYLDRIVRLDISRNNLTFITGEVMNALKPKKVSLDISSNKLKYLPIRIRDFKDVNISGNPLMCDCNSTWMIDWAELDLHNMNISLIKCTLPESDERVYVVQADHNTLGCSQKFSVILSVVLGSLILVVIIIVIICCVFKYEIQLILNERNKGKNHEAFTNDVYVCVNDEEEFDRGWVIQTLLPVLEGRHRLRVYFPPRDMLPGSVAADESIKEIKRSRAVVVVLTQSYIDNTQKAYEFSTIYDVVVKPNKAKLIIVKFPRVNWKGLRKLRAFIRLKKYIGADDRKLCVKIMDIMYGDNKLEHQITTTGRLVSCRL